MENEKKKNHDQEVSQDSTSPKQPISRRSLLKKTGIAGISVVAAASIPEGIASAQSLPSPNDITHSTLSADDPLRQRIMSSADMQSLLHQYGSKLAQAEAIHSTYLHTDLELVAVSLQQFGNPYRSILAYLKPTSSKIAIMQFEFVPDSEMTTALKAGNKQVFSGRATVYSASGLVITGAQYHLSKVIATVKPNTLMAPAGEDWGCFANCFQQLFPSLPWWLQFLCGNICGGCFGGFVPMCPACGACAGGYVGFCLGYCWSW